MIVVAALVAGRALASTALPPGEPSCLGELTPQALGSAREIPVVGVTPVSTTFAVRLAADVLIDAQESGSDVFVDVDGTDRSPAVHSDNPVRRTGRQWVLVSVRGAGPLGVRLTGKEHPEVSGRVRLRAYALVAGHLSPRCVDAVRALAAADASYARGQDVSRALSAAGGASVRHQYLVAVENYLRAYQLLDSPADAPLRVTVGLAIATVYFQDLKEWARSAEWAERVQVEGRRLHLDYESARAGAVLANAWLELPATFGGSTKTAAISEAARARMEQTRALLRTLEQFHRRRGERFDAALQLNNIGHTYYVEGNFREAEPYYRQAATDFAALHESPRVGNGFHLIAMCQWGRGDVLAAIGTFRQALAKLGPAVEPRLYLYTLVDFALAAFAAGDLDTSLRVNAQSLALARAMQDARAESWNLYGLGVTYYALGDRELARQYLSESLAIRSAGVEPGVRMAAQRALSAVYVDEGRLDAAVAADEEALALAVSPHRRLRNLIRLAADTGASGRTAQALELLQTALEHPDADDEELKADALIARGHIYRVAGRPADAVRDLEAALAIVRRHDDPDQDFRANLDLAATWVSLQKPDAALLAVDRALNRSDELRRRTANPEFRAQRQAPLRPAYDLKLALLAERYRQQTADGETDAAQNTTLLALRTAEHARAQSLADLSSLSYAANDPALRSKLESRERLYRELAARRFGLEGRADSSGADDPRAVALRADITAIRRDLDLLDADIASRSGVRSSTLRERPASWPALLRTQSPDSVIVAYWLGAREAYAWTLTRDGIGWTMLGDSTPITDAARAMHAAFKGYATRPQNDRDEAAAALYDRIIRPLGARAGSGRQLIVVPDGALSYVPFAALRTGRDEGSRYLVADHDVALAPAVWWLFSRPAALPSTRPSRVLLVSDPIYEGADPRRPPSGQPIAGKIPLEAAAERTGRHQFDGLERLPWTAREADAIATLVPSSDVDQLSGATATRPRLLAIDWSKYRIIHLASHATVDAAMPQLSALLLGAYDERGQRVEQAVRAVDLESLTLHADIVALSACDTALGRDIVGEGAVGLASTTLARGAGTVLASLWPSSDEISSRLMTEFYRGVLIGRRSPSNALGSAMRTMLGRNSRADPAFWAVYQLSISQANL